ncbi:hypothetical protein ABMA27_006828 [Loxostege sticticalis]|uniref:Gamma-interferon-inducible lysosomal thiol reductase n=1 Tax=Loxostege sticticalis TaxID=481309 RepID=A0ABR3IKM7_LOXSC
MNLLKIMVIVLFSVTLCGTLEINHSSQYEEHDKRKLHEKEINRVTLDNSSRNKVQIKVYYESLCPGSINFLTNHLRPAVEALAPYLDIHLVPYGHAKTREIFGQYSFACQHGPEECFGNRLHACAIDVLKNETQAVLFNACLMQFSQYRGMPGFDYAIVVNWCNYKLQTRTEGIWACVNGERSSTLLKTYGEETRALKLRYVPYVIVGDSTDEQDRGGDLVSTICHKLDPAPPPCDGWRRIYP